MSNKRFEVYKNQVFRLAKTLVFKYDAIRVMIDQGLLLKGVDTSAETPYQSKYYLNLAGLPHPSDPEILIRSIEDQLTVQFIDFSRANLKDRPTTRREYSYDSLFYNDLIRQFPDQEPRILGVLYPIVDADDVNIAIAASVEKVVLAQDGDILQWDRTLVEENETDLIPRLQDWIKYFLRRWTVQEYAITDDYYITTMLGVLYAQLPSVIMNIRLSNCKTDRAHSFHIREYLESNGRLGEYINTVNTRQRLWLYRNLRYVHRNAGKQETFRDLVDILFTERRFPLLGHSLKHDLVNQPIDDYPTIKSVRTNINQLLNSTSLNVVTPTYLVELGLELGQENALDLDQGVQRTVELMRNSQSDLVPTKALESVLVSNTTADVYPLFDILFSNWVYEAVQERYSSPVFVTNPTDGTRLFLNTRDAFILYLYVYTYGYSKDPLGNPISLTEIPPFYVLNILREQYPTLQQLRDVVDRKLIGDDRLQPILQNVPNRPNIYLSVDAFYDDMMSRREYMYRLRDLYVKEEDYEIRGYMEFAVNMLYKDVGLELVDSPTLYVDWLQDQGIDLTDLTPEQAAKLAVDIVSAATIPVFSKSKLSDIQEAMADIMSQLSSYSIQILKSEENGLIYVEDACSLRVGRIKRDINTVQDVAIPTVYNIRTQGHIYEKAFVRVAPDTEDSKLYHEMRSYYRLDPTLSIKARDVGVDYVHVQEPQFIWRILDTEQVDLTTAITVTDLPNVT